MEPGDPGSGRRCLQQCGNKYWVLRACFACSGEVPGAVFWNPEERGMKS